MSDAPDRHWGAFESILYQQTTDGATAHSPPEYFRDLNLDQIVDAIVAGREEYELKPFFYAPLATVEAVSYRHEVRRDVEVERTRRCIEAFAADARLMRRKIEQADALYCRLQKHRWLLHAVETYCAAVVALAEELPHLDLRSRGLRAFRDYVSAYAVSERFTAFEAESREVARELASVRYAILIKGNGLTVRRYEDEEDYSADVAATFKKFQQGAPKSYRVQFREPVELNHIEAKVLEFVSSLYPETFARLDRFCTTYREFADRVLMRFDREIQFYLAYAEHMRRFTDAGLSFAYPRVSDREKTVRVAGGFDLALALKLVEAHEPVICNDFELTGEERTLVVSGPNQGGKTTFGRMFGQIHHLASLGCPVQGSEATVLLFDSMFTHFEREETIESLRGKLQDDLVRIHEILDVATPRSIVIVNEIFNSTTLTDAVFLAKKVIARIAELDLICVCVTFLDELSSLSEKTVSMTSTVDPNDPAVRTFKVVRRPADGRAYAIAIAEKYGLTYDRVKARLGTRG